MAKHNRHNKKIIRKRVKKNAKKLKELTAQDILLNPALVESPQFKQLPPEKQILLMSQVKQLRALMSGRIGVGGGPIATHSGSNVDPALLSRVNEANNKTSHLTNENEQLRIALQAANEAYKKEKEITQEIKRKSQEQKDSIDRAARIDDLEQQKRHLDLQAEDKETRLLEKEIKEKSDLAHLNELKEKQREKAKLKAQLDLITGTPKPKKRYSSPPASEGKKRILSEIYNQTKNNRLNKQYILQNEINSFIDNGDINNAEKTEIDLNLSFNDNDDDKKKPLIESYLEEEENEENDISLLQTPEKEAIEEEVKLTKENQTRREQLEELEALEKQKQENSERIDRNLINYRSKPYSTKDKFDFETEKLRALDKLDGVLSMVDNPDADYKLKLTYKIDSAETYNELDNILKKLNLDISNQEEFIKQNEILKTKKDECLNKLQESRKLNIQNPIPFDSWKVKIERANSIEEILNVERMINLYHRSIDILASESNEQKQKSLDESTSREAHSRASEAVDTIISIKKYLQTNESRTKPKAFIDGDKEKQFSPGTNELRPSKDIEYVDISQYVYDPSKHSIPNDILLNGIDLGNVIKRFGASSEKGKFFASLAWKLTCFIGRNAKKFVFYTVNVGTSIAIAAVPKVIDIAAKNPKTFAAGIGGFALYKWIKDKWFKGDENKIFKNKDKLNTEKVIKVGDNKEKPHSPTKEEISRLLGPKRLDFDFSIYDEEEEVDEKPQPKTEKKKRSWFGFW